MVDANGVVGLDIVTFVFLPVSAFARHYVVVLVVVELDLLVPSGHYLLLVTQWSSITSDFTLALSLSVRGFSIRSLRLLL